MFAFGHHGRPPTPPTLPATLAAAIVVFFLHALFAARISYWCLNRLKGHQTNELETLLTWTLATDNFVTAVFFANFPLMAVIAVVAFAAWRVSRIRQPRATSLAWFLRAWAFS